MGARVLGTGSPALHVVNPQGLVIIGVGCLIIVPVHRYRNFDGIIRVPARIVAEVMLEDRVAVQVTQAEAYANVGIRDAILFIRVPNMTRQQVLDTALGTTAQGEVVLDRISNFVGNTFKQIHFLTGDGWISLFRG